MCRPHEVNSERRLTAAIFACNDGGILVAPAPLDKAETAREADGLRDAVAGRGVTGVVRELDIVAVAVVGVIEVEEVVVDGVVVGEEGSGSMIL